MRRITIVMLTFASCGLAEEKTTADSKDVVNRIFAGRLLEIASEYQGYDRIDQSIRWAPMLCSAPPKHPSNQASLSDSQSQATHGQKLYYLYARKSWQYKLQVWQPPSTPSSQATRAPLGQVLVKEAWMPVKDPQENSNQSRKPIPKLQTQQQQENQRTNDEEESATEQTPFAVRDGVTYRAGAKKGLFIMFKTHESTPGTDRGWVYGTVSPDGTKVTSVGLVKNCMKCHQSAPYDRQIGLSRSSKNPAKLLQRAPLDAR